MKSLSIILSILILTSACTGGKNRGPASTNNESQATVGKVEIYRIGEIKISLLSADKFRQIYGSAWKLMDGATIEDGSASLFHDLTGLTKIPDARGKFLRMANNGLDRNNPGANPDNTALGDFQGDDFKAHNHKMSDGGRHLQAHGNSSQSPEAHGFNGPMYTSDRGGLETRPKNITVNYFVKVSNCDPSEEFCI